MFGRARLMAAWNSLRATYWFAPSLMTLAAAALALLSVEVDRRVDDAFWLGWAYGGGADGARSLLSAVAGSAITVVSLTFSVTIVALTVSAQHFGPRLLANFMRDTAAQLVLGMLISTFGFCLLVLRTVRGETDTSPAFVPHLSVTVAVVLAMVSVAALIYYLHHVAASIQVSQIAANVTRDLEAAIRRLYPDGAQAAAPSPVAAPPDTAAAVAAGASGYVQAVDLDGLVSLAQQHDTMVWLRARPGDFVIEGMVLAEVAPPRADDLADAIRGAYALGLDRTAWQDAEFAIQQLVEVALHALSPGINEPFTAITCIDRLAQGLSLMAERQVPGAALLDEAGQPRVITEPKSFRALVAAAFDPIVLFAGGNPMIYCRVLEMLAEIGRRTRAAADRAAIGEQASSIGDAARRHLSDERDRRAIDDRLAAVQRSLAVSKQQAADQIGPGARE